MVDERERVAAELETAQAQARDSLAADQEDIEAKLTDARSDARSESGASVPRALLLSATIAFGRASASTPFFRCAATRAAIATR